MLISIIFFYRIFSKLQLLKPSETLRYTKKSPPPPKKPGSPNHGFEEQIKLKENRRSERVTLYTTEMQRYIYLTTPPLGQNMTQSQFLSGV